VNKTMITTFEEIIKQYRPSTHNGTTSVSSIIMEEGTALLRVETASMASKFVIQEALTEESNVKPHVIKSLEKSLKDNATIWEELSKH
jgi:hypothetical protein